MDSSIQLSKRLQAVTAMVPKCDCVADVGCDHGYSSIFLVQSGIARSAIAMDVRKGPLKRAQEHIQQRQLASYIQVRLSDGLQQLRPGEADAIVIAGMGGATMRKILEQGRGLLTEEVTLVLQPQSEIRQSRSYLAEAGFWFSREDMVLEDGKYYPMMQVSLKGTGVGETGQQPVTDGTADAGASFTTEELAFGPLLLKHRHPVLHQYLIWRQAQVQQILMQIQGQAAEEVRVKRTRELTEELAMIRRGLAYYNL